MEDCGRGIGSSRDRRVDATFSAIDTFIACSAAAASAAVAAAAATALSFVAVVERLLNLMTKTIIIVRCSIYTTTNHVCGQRSCDWAIVMPCIC